MQRLAVSLGSWFVLLLLACQVSAETPLCDLVDPFLGTAPVTDVKEIGFDPSYRVWAGLTYPGATLPNAMVQLSPITQFRSGAGYEYEDNVIRAFTHTNKGHWNLCYLPVLPISGELNPWRYGSTFSHEQEEASPGYYRVHLDRYGINAELTVTPRCGFHRYTYATNQGKTTQEKSLVFSLGVSNERVRDSQLQQVDAHSLSGFQHANEKVYFYAQTNHEITEVASRGRRRWTLSHVKFAPRDEPVELRIGLSFVSVENAKQNLEQELAGKGFDQVRAEAAGKWEEVLADVQVTGGTEREKRLFYSCLYRAFQWPALRSDFNGEFTNSRGEVVNKGFRYYTVPALWDTYRNKLVLLTLLRPKVAEDVIQSMIDRGEASGYMPTFFHGDHAAPFVAGAYARGLRGFDAQAAYKLLLKNATVESRRARPHLAEYVEKGYIATPEIKAPEVETKAKAGVTKTLEYAYDDYALAQLAERLGDSKIAEEMLQRSQNYKNLFDKSTGLMRGRLASGAWVDPFDSQYPYYEYMYREANAWQSSFFAPHDTRGLVALHGSPAAFERQLDQLFSTPWNPRHIARNVSGFIGQYCHGNQPDHSYPYLYYWVDKPEKSQQILDEIMRRFYGMKSGHTLVGMDDAGEMSSWFVFNAIGIYPYSPADPEYLVCAPVFDAVRLKVNKQTIHIIKQNKGRRLTGITLGEDRVEGYTIGHQELLQARELRIETAD